MLKLHHYVIALLLIVLLPTAAFADNRFGFGWQYSGPASGFSLKLPVDRYLILQPTLSLALQDRAEGSSGHTAYGLRAYMDLPAVGLIHPYLGAGLGRSERFVSGESQVTQGYQAFLGLEYQLSHLRPSFEVALGRVERPDGSSYLGTMFNFGLHYYF